MLYELTREEIPPEIASEIRWPLGNMDSHLYKANIGYYLHIPGVFNRCIAEDDGLHRCAIYVNVSAEGSEVYFGVCGGWDPDDGEDEYRRYCYHPNTYTRGELFNKLCQAADPADHSCIDVGVALFNIYRTTREYPDNYDNVNEIIERMKKENVYPFGNNNLCPLEPGSNLRLQEFVYEEYDENGNLIMSEPKFKVDKTHWLN